MSHARPQELIKKNVSLKKYSTFGIGGFATYFSEAKTIDDLLFSLKYAKEHKLRVFVLGKGSNVLFDDRGYNGLVILNKLQTIKYEDMLVTASAGYSFALLGIQTARKNLSGLEFASGIPGSVGGAIFMNAGASGSDVSKVLKKATYIDTELNIRTLANEQLDFSYRTSIFQKKGFVIISGCFSLCVSETARSKQKGDLKRRFDSQPYKEKSAGCAFRNPQAASAGFLIENSGLKGKSVGGAFVSEKHANFIVNKGGATSSDVLQLIENVKSEILLRHNIELECEVRYIPFE
ncbi:UDP-N-acetylenolpyruvoylglucosamine reductase [Candidatus Aerophobetes bacterium]|uniref:UDP-N-acetylenolpyruvoylglucosamine reductase n=1 Tax=Aerophobetes bacterium TaxID=2030807 RepID=A0A2A4YCA0_UNCAE|nr:MAG: UDP-N-acetylenolpyruvoylglucosamine reductase [Candidatus Aerophobetes bacterium]